MVSGDAESKRKWKRVLPSLDQLEFLYVKTRVNQELFDSICSLTGLKRLSIDSTSIHNCASLTNLGRLSHLAIGSSPKLSGLAPLSSLTQLESLDLSGNFRNIRDLKPLCNLSRLRGLGLRGMESHVQVYESLKPLAKLSRLRYLLITGIRVERDGLIPLTALRKLEYLSLNLRELKQWRGDDFRRLDEHLTMLKTNLIELAANDRAFQLAYGID